MFQQEAKKTVRCLTVLKEYVAECDDEYAEERAILPHGRCVLSHTCVSHGPMQMTTTSVNCHL